MKKQWRKFLRESTRKKLYESELSYSAVPCLLRSLDKSIKAGCGADVESILGTLWVKHGIALDSNGDLRFIKDVPSDRIVVFCFALAGK